jgi:hypothetical protein
MEILFVISQLTSKPASPNVQDLQVQPKLNFLLVVLVLDVQLKQQHWLNSQSYEQQFVLVLYSCNGFDKLINPFV